MRSNRPATKANRPRPPEDMDGEALLEWDRVCDELAAAGRLDSTDRALLTIYCQTWAIYQTVMRRVAKDGPVVKHNNGVAGASPFYTVSREMAGHLRRLLSDMGLTPAARGKGAATAGEEPLDV
jgi:P27 family predicted phage terminase small subunit